jgi:anaphase-promoting complex subunit 1
VSMFDHRWDGEVERSLIAICLPAMGVLPIFTLTKSDGRLKVALLSQLFAISAVSICATRNHVFDLLIVKPDNQLAIFTHGLCELPLNLQQDTLSSAKEDDVVEIDAAHGALFSAPIVLHKCVVSVRDAVHSSFTVVFDDGSTSRTTIDLISQDSLTCQSLQVLALALPSDAFFFSPSHVLGDVVFARAADDRWRRIRLFYRCVV